MIKSNSKIKYLFLLSLMYSLASFAQTGMNFQGVARNSNGVILASQTITIRLSILQGTVTGNIEYQETKSLNTNAQGLFNLVIGDGTATTTTGNYNNINWQQSPKFVKIEMDANAGNNFTTLGTTQLQYVAYAYFANSVAAENIVGLLPVTRGGTGTSTLLDLKNNLQIDKVNNTADSLKPISKAVITALLSKLNSADTIYLSNRINTKLNTTDTIGLIRLINSKFSTADTLSLSNRINLKMNQTDGLSALAFKANTIDVSTALGAKENTNNKSTANDLGGLTPSDILFPTQKAVKEYVTANSASGGVVDGGITSIKLADGAVTSIKLSDLAVTDAKIATGISKSKVGLGNVENTALSTWAGSNNLTTVGTISTGIWSGTSVAITNGGTGATTAAAARSNLGLVIGTNVQAPLIAGTDYLTPTGSAISLTNFPTLNQNTTGNAATATIAGNITTTSNNTLTALPNLTSVGTINSGSWSATLIDVAHGGTGTSTVAANTFFSGPNGSGGSPNFRTLNIADIPDLSSKYILNNTYPWQMQSGDVTTTGGAIFGKDITVAGQRIGIGEDDDQGHLNLLFGKQSLASITPYWVSNTAATINTSIGPYSQLNFQEGSKNTSLGGFSLANLNFGNNNTSIGAYSFTQNNLNENSGNDGEITYRNGNNNTALGAFALSYSPFPTYMASYIERNQNTAIGAYTLSSLIEETSSDNNTAIGFKAGSNLLTGSNNIFIGNNTQPFSTSVSNQIIIGNASNTSFYIYGALTTTGRISKLATVTSNYTILPSDEIITANSSSPINIYLPSAIGITGRTYTIKNINTGVVTILTTLSQKIDASNTYQLSNQYSFIKVISNGTKWLVAGLDNVSYSVSGGLTLTDLATSNVKAKTFELTQPSSINSTSTTTLDLSSGNILQVVLTGSTTLAFINPKVGTYIIKIKQDGTGNWALNFPTIKWADATAPTITTTANAIDLITLIYDGVDYYGSCLQNF